MPRRVSRPWMSKDITSSPRRPVGPLLWRQSPNVQSSPPVPLQQRSSNPLSTQQDIGSEDETDTMSINGEHGPIRQPEEKSEGSMQNDQPSQPSSTLSALDSDEIDHLSITSSQVRPDPRRSTSRSSAPTNPRARYRTFKKTMEFWAQNHYSFKRFLRDYVACHALDDDPPHIQRAAKSARGHRIKNMKAAFEVEDVREVVLKALEWHSKPCIYQIIRELESLIGKYPFVDWTAHKDVEYNAKAAARLIEKWAPTWWQLWTQVLQNSRSALKYTTNAVETEDVDVDNTFDGEHSYHWVVLATAVALRARGKKRANLIITNLSLYLHGCSMKKRSYEFLQKHGLVISLRTLSDRHAEIEDASKLAIRRYGADPRLVITYDNYDFLDTVHDQVTGSVAVMRNLTTAFISLSPGIPLTGLQQTMLTRTAPLESFALIRDSLDSRHLLGEEIENDFIIQAILHCHPTSMRKALRNWDIPTIGYRVVEQANIQKTDFVELKGMHRNSGTKEGTFKVHEDIMKQLNMDPEKETDFLNRLIIIFGDQKTAFLSRNARVDRVDSLSVFERRDWLLPVIALFHVQMNLLQGVIPRTHWSPVKPKGNGAASDEANIRQFSAHTLQADIQHLHYKGMSLDNAPFHLLDSLLLESFYARLLAMFYKYLRKMQLFDPQTQLPFEAIDHIIPLLSKQQFEDVLQGIRNEVFTSDAWRGRPGDSPSFTTLCRLLQECKINFTLREAIRRGDIGMIRKLVPILATMFYGSGKPRYGFEMLHLQWLLQDSVSSPELQHAILVGSLVNRKGYSSSFMPVDRLMELLNAALKHDMKDKKTSTHDWKSTFEQFPLRSPYLGRQKKMLEQQTNVTISGAHTDKSSASDVQSLALKLLVDGEMEQVGHGHPTYEYLSPDIITIAMNQLANKVAMFNESVEEGQFGLNEHNEDMGPGIGGAETTSLM